MIRFFIENMATILVGLFVFALLALVIVHMRRNKKRQKRNAGCGYGCANCPHAAHCK